MNDDNLSYVGRIIPDVYGRAGPDLADQSAEPFGEVLDTLDLDSIAMQLLVGLLYHEDLVDCLRLHRQDAGLETVPGRRRTFRLAKRRVD